MNIYVMNQMRARIGIIDYYKSIIWTERYYEPGDFELCLPANAENVNLCQKGMILYRDVDYDSATDTIKSAMVIEYVQVSTSTEEGDILVLQGRDLKSILYKRIVWEQTILSGTLENNIRAILTQNIIAPAASARRIALVLGSEMGGTETVRTQVTGDNIGEWVTEALRPHEIGYRVQIVGGQFTFTLYKGADRSYAQSENPYVVFSQSFDNLLTSDFASDSRDMCNVAVIAGEGEGSNRKRAYIEVSQATGLNRSELYVDARDLSTTSGDGEISAAEYSAQLITRGHEALAEHAVIEAFEGQIDAEGNYVYGVDYSLGDKVQIINDYGLQRAGRIIEVIDSEDETGRTIIPTFSTGGSAS